MRGSVLAARVRAALDVDVSAELLEVRAPITYFAATQDALVRGALSEELRALVPSLEVRRFDCAHLLLQLQPREAAAALGELAAKLDTKRSRAQ